MTRRLSKREPARRVDARPRDLEVVGRTSLGQARWDAFVDGSTEAWLWDSYDLREPALSDWPHSEDVSFGVIDPAGNVLAIASAQVVHDRRLRYLPWRIVLADGLAFADGIGRRYRRRIDEVSLDHLSTIASAVGAGQIRIRLPLLAPRWRGDACPPVSPLVRFEGDDVSTLTWVVDLRGGEDAVWSRMMDSGRGAVRRARREGVSVRESVDRDDFDEFCQLYHETYSRTGGREMPLCYLEGIWTSCVRRGRARLSVAEVSGELLAAAVFVEYKRAGHYWVGGSSDRGLAVAANSAVQWHAMRQMIGRGIEWCDTGEAHLAARGKALALSRYKRTFGGRLFPLYAVRIAVNRRAELVRGIAATAEAVRGFRPPQVVTVGTVSNSSSGDDVATPGVPPAS